MFSGKKRDSPPFFLDKTAGISAVWYRRVRGPDTTVTKHSVSVARGVCAGFLGGTRTQTVLVCRGKFTLTSPRTYDSGRSRRHCGSPQRAASAHARKLRVESPALRLLLDEGRDTRRCAQKTERGQKPQTCTARFAVTSWPRAALRERPATSSENDLGFSAGQAPVQSREETAPGLRTKHGGALPVPNTIKFTRAREAPMGCNRPRDALRCHINVVCHRPLQ